MDFAIGLSGTDLLEIARRIQQAGIVGHGPPLRLSVDHRKKAATADWIDRYAATMRASVMAHWAESLAPSPFLSIDKNYVVKVDTSVDRIEPRTVLSLLSRLPFELASFLQVHDWAADDQRYIAAGFANLHYPHGWACAFKGAGHARLVSRRWLDFGPWLVRRGENDTTLVQFHDLDADSATALEQARPGHEAMGISMTGGFLQWPGYVMRHDIGGLYVAASRELRVIVHGRDVPESEMTDAAATRAFHLLGEDKPVDKVSYVFMDEALARNHLHALWLRDIEVRALIGGAEVRVDEGYAPVPKKPDWVLRVLERERP